MKLFKYKSRALHKLKAGFNINLGSKQASLMIYLNMLECSWVFSHVHDYSSHVLQYIMLLILKLGWKCEICVSS